MDPVKLAKRRKEDAKKDKELSKKMMDITKAKSVKCKKCKRVIKYGECCVTETGTKNQYHLGCHAVLLTSEPSAQVLEAQDYIIPQLHFTNPCPVKIILTENRVELYLAARDIQWAKTKKGWEHIASGTTLEDADRVPDLPSEQHEEKLAPEPPEVGYDSATDSPDSVTEDRTDSPEQMSDEEAVAFGLEVQDKDKY